MKRAIIIFLLNVPLALFAQSKADTVITKDPLNPGREYWAIRSASGLVTSQGFMLNGKKEGVWRMYNEDRGKLTTVEEYSKGVLNGASMTFYINGSITSDLTFMNGKLNGQSETMNNYGNIRVIENYKDSILNGLKRTYYETFRLQEDGSYKNGQRHGLVKWYKSDGTPTLENTYNSGLLEGPAKEYDEKGNLKRSGVYKNNVESGEWQEYQDSVMVKKIIYKEGLVVKEVPVKK